MFLFLIEPLTPRPYSSGCLELCCFFFFLIEWWGSLPGIYWMRYMAFRKKNYPVPHEILRFSLNPGRHNFKWWKDSEHAYSFQLGREKQGYAAFRVECFSHQHFLLGISFALSSFHVLLGTLFYNILGSILCWYNLYLEPTLCTHLPVSRWRAFNAGLGNVWPAGQIRTTKSFGLATQKPLQVGLKIQYIYSRLIFKLIILYGLRMML